MRTILLIEDNQSIRENTIEILEMGGYKVIIATNGITGFDHALQHRPDLIICDILMPGLDGYGVIDAIKNDCTTKHIPFVFVTAQAERSSLQKAMELGANAYLVKPLDPALLLQTVEEQLSKSIVKNAV